MGDTEADIATGYDFCIVFPAPNEDGKFAEEGKEIAKRITKCNFDCKFYPSIQNDEIICLIRVPHETLAAFADKIDFKLLMDKDALRAAAQNGDPENQIAPIEINHDPYISFRLPYQDIYCKYDTAESLQPLYWREPGCEQFFRPQTRLKLIAIMLEAPGSDGGCGLSLRALKNDQTILAFYPLHDQERLNALSANWIKAVAAPWEQPLWDIKEYFGEKIGLYFAFLGHYATQLLWPAIIGIIVQAHVLATLNTSAASVAIFAIFVSFWCILMLELWKRKEATLAMEWGMIGFEEEEQDRPEFNGDRIKSFVDGKDILYFPESQRAGLIATSILIVFSMVAVVIGVVVAIFVIRFTMVDAGGASASLGPPVASVLNALSIQIMNFIYGKIAYFLTDRENHKTDTAYEDSLISKIFMFQFVNSYSSFFYLAFIQEPILGDECDSGSCMNALAINLTIIFGARLVTGNIFELGLPLLKAEKRERAETAGAEKPATRPEQEYIKEPYDQVKGPLQDYAELAIQFGYVTLFVVALPIAAALAFVNNYIEIRGDAWKLVNLMQRPVPWGGEDIGAWQSIFTIIAVVSVMTNGALTCFTMDIFDGLLLSTRLWLFVLFQYVIFFLLYIFALVVPDVPEDIGIQVQRNDFLTEKIIDKVADENDDELLERMRTDTGEIVVEQA